VRGVDSLVILLSIQPLDQVNPPLGQGRMHDLTEGFMQRSSYSPDSG
jgi:hypothetical protein